MSGDIQFETNGALNIVGARSIETRTVDASVSVSTRDATTDRMIVNSYLDVTQGQMRARISPGRITLTHFINTPVANVGLLEADTGRQVNAEVGRGRHHDDEGTLQQGTDGKFAVFRAGREEPTVEIDGNAGTIRAIGEIQQISDLSTKQDIAPIDSAMTRLASLSGVTWTPVGGGSRRAGVVAQHVEEALPEAVTLGPDGLRAVSYAGVTGLLVEAVRELQDEVTRLRAELAEVGRARA